MQQLAVRRQKQCTWFCARIAISTPDHARLSAAADPSKTYDASSKRCLTKTLTADHVDAATVRGRSQRAAFGFEPEDLGSDICASHGR